MHPLILAAESGHDVTVGRLLPIVGLVVFVAAASAAARRLPIVAPIVLVLAGFGLSYVPGVPEYRLDPDLVLVLILPPLLYAAAWVMPLRAFKANARPILLLSVGLVLFTSVVVGITAMAVIPGLSFAAALALGAIVAPPDAVATTAVASRAGLPRRIVTILEGESLVNDATALTTYRLAVGAVATGGLSLPAFGRGFLLAAMGGAVIGLAVGWVHAWVRRRVDEPVLDTTLTLVGPFLAYVPAEEIGASGVIAVVAAGLYLGNRWPRETNAASRIQSQNLWETLRFLLEGAVFALIGLQLRSILGSLSSYAVSTVATATVAVVLAVILSRFVWIYPATYLARLVPRVRRRDPTPPWQYPTVIGWAGMRGVVSLAAAAALPEDFPDRELLVFLTFVAIVATLVLQGLTLPWVIRRLGLTGPTRTELALQEAAVQQEAVAAALKRLEGLLEHEDGLPPDVVDRLRDKATLRTYSAWERLGSRDRETPSASFRRLRRQLLDAEREVFIRARDDGRLDQEAFLDVLRELDTEEQLLQRE